MSPLEIGRRQSHANSIVLVPVDGFAFDDRAIGEKSVERVTASAELVLQGFAGNCAANGFAAFAVLHRKSHSTIHVDARITEASYQRHIFSLPVSDQYVASARASQ